MIFFLSALTATLALACSTPEPSMDVVQNLDCDVREIARQINEESFQVPAHLFHFGPRPYLEQDIAQKNVPEDAWKNKIMGGETKFGLGAIRRGLYGTAGLDTNRFGYDENSWLLVVKLKDQCRTPSSVVTLNDLPTSPRFARWIARHAEKVRALFASAEDFMAKCYGRGGPLASFRGDFPNPKCETLLAQYLNDADEPVAVVQDGNVQKSFYVRDRACIESIRGTPREILELSREKHLWLTPCGGQNEGAESFARIVSQAILEVGGDQTPLLDELIETSKLAQADSVFRALKACLIAGHPEKFRERLAFALIGTPCG